MTAVEINKITIDRAKRQRRELTDIEEMMDSLKRRGQIQNIVINQDHELVVGERRLEAAKRLGWTHIKAEFVENLEPNELHAIELEENVKRRDLPWQDECRAVLEYHEFRKSEEPGWSLEKTGDELGYPIKSIHVRIQVGLELRKGNEMVSQAPRFSTAVGIVERAQDRAMLTDIVSLKQTAGSAVIQDEVILIEDFNTWAPAYVGPKFNFLHCDFPYGIGADKFNQGAATLHGGYEDTEKIYWILLGTLMDNLDRLCADQCHVMFWFSMQHYDSTRDFLSREHGFRVDRFPLVWTKSDNIGILPDPERGPRRIYETALFGSRGDRKVVRSVSNSIAHPSQRDEHMSIKPDTMLEHFFRMFVDTSTTMLDPTCGSGSSLRAAKRLGATHILGLEKNPEFANRARLAYKAGA